MQKYYQKISPLNYNGVLSTYFANAEDWAWLYEYLPTVDLLLMQSKGSLQLLRKYWTSDRFPAATDADEKRRQELRKDLRAVYAGYKYELQKLIATMELEYNPLWNVDATIVTKHTGNDAKKVNEDSNRDIFSDVNTTTDSTDTHTGTDNLSDKYGAQTETSSNDSTTNFGQVRTTTTNTQSVSPEDVNTWYNNTKNDGSDTTSARTDTTNQNESVALNEHTDTHNRTVDFTDTTKGTTQQGTDANDKFARELNDVTTTSYTDSVIRTGNIGVTSSQQLITAEREVAKFSICERIRDIFVKHFCMMIYSEIIEESDGDWEYGDYIL